MKAKKRVVPMMESLEKRDVPAIPTAFGFVPALTTNAISNAVRSLDRALGTVARTHDFNRLSGDLAAISSHLPYGLRNLNPTWQADVGIYSPFVRGSGLVMRQQMVNDLRAYAVNGIATAQFVVTGPAASFYFTTAGGFGSRL